ncbi:hypothetical protein [Terribacillus saccharophilus]|uniref:hypothetical protein n=1 Tax=Terribacillus saccharophilus TaxID=361277 RepID=UPI003D2D0F23
MADEMQKAVLTYIAMQLSYKNCQLDLIESKPRVIEKFDKINLQAGFITTRYTEAVMQLLKADMEALHNKYNLFVKVTKKGSGWRTYEYRTRYGSSSFRITNERLLHLIKSTSAAYFSDERVKVQPKPWY